jgi:hypothetical protein
MSSLSANAVLPASLCSRASLRGASLPAAAACLPVRSRPARLRVTAGNDQESGPFAPLVVVVRNAMGAKPFNQFRGKAISLHSQVRAWAGWAPL